MKLVTRLEELHDSGFIHRDMKPENVMLGLRPTGKSGAKGKQTGSEWDLELAAMATLPDVFLIDLALAKKYADPKDIENTHIPEDEVVTAVGTCRYMALHAHRGVAQSRRSDLEAAAYVLIELGSTSLPWSDDPKEVAAAKSRLSAREISEGLPECLTEFLKATMRIGYSEKPDYDALRMILLKGAVSLQPSQEAAQEESRPAEDEEGTEAGSSAPGDHEADRMVLALSKFKGGRVEALLREKIWKFLHKREFSFDCEQRLRKRQGNPSMAPSTPYFPAVAIYVHQFSREKGPPSPKDWSAFRNGSKLSPFWPPLAEYEEACKRARHPDIERDPELDEDYFFEAYSAQLLGTIHVQAGLLHFYAFAHRETALEYLSQRNAKAREFGLASKTVPRARAERIDLGMIEIERILHLSGGEQDWVVRARCLHDYNVPDEQEVGESKFEDSSGGGPTTPPGRYKGWDLRAAFFAKVIRIPRARTYRF